jgi:hypothetical protein
MKRRTIFQSIFALLAGGKVISGVAPNKPAQFLPETSLEEWRCFFPDTTFRITTEENCAILRDQSVSVRPNDNHSDHIRLHLEFARKYGVNNCALHCHIHEHLMLEGPK